MFNGNDHGGTSPSHPEPEKKPEQPLKAAPAKPRPPHGQGTEPKK